MLSNEVKSSFFRHEIISISKWFYNFTSIAGITQMRTTDTKSSRCIWLLLAIVAVGFTSFLVQQTVENYFSYNTVTTINIRSESKLEFPSVTICNQNRIHCRHLYNLIQNCTAVSIWIRILLWMIKIWYYNAFGV